MKFSKFMNADTGAEGGVPEAPVSETKTETTKENMIPKHRFDEVYSEMKTLKEQLKAFEDSKAEENRKALETKEEYKKLYEQSKADLERYKPLETKVAEYEATMAQLVESKVATVPEEFKDLIPDNLTVKEKLAWLDKAEEKGLFGKKSVGRQSNPPDQKPDISAMSAHDKLLMAYEQGKNKK